MTDEEWLERYKRAKRACREWQKGPHIDSLPTMPRLHVVLANPPKVVNMPENEWRPTVELRWLLAPHGRTLQQKWNEWQFFYGYGGAQTVDRWEETGKTEWRNVPEVTD